MALLAALEASKLEIDGRWVGENEGGWKFPGGFGGLGVTFSLWFFWMWTFWNLKLTFIYKFVYKLRICRTVVFFVFFGGFLLTKKPFFWLMDFHFNLRLSPHRRFRLDNFQPTHRVFPREGRGKRHRPGPTAAAFLRFEDLELEQALEASLLPGWKRLESPALAVFGYHPGCFPQKPWLFRGI